MTNDFQITNPKKVGMEPIPMENAFRILKKEVDQKRLPGAVALIGRKGYIVGSFSAGNTNEGWEHHNHKVSLDTIYDVASLTKTTVTLPLILQLVDYGEIVLDDFVTKYISSYQENVDITIRQLLNHTSGLPSGLKDVDGRSGEEIREQVYVLGTVYKPGTDMVYSDVGFMLLGEIIENFYGKPLNHVAMERIFKPLDMKDSEFLPPHKLKYRIAATEYREDLGNYQQGEVHDECARALGGVSGHAGLFSTALDLAKYAMMWLGEGKYLEQRILSRSVVSQSIQTQTPHLAANRGLGWVLKNDEFDASGDLFSDSAFGHTGFTGTSMWMDPKEDLFVILLTNRVHFGRDIDINHIRKRFHNAVMASLV